MKTTRRRYPMPVNRWDGGWPYGGPYGVTWHWTATWDLETCRRLIGPAGLRTNASVHYAVGRSQVEGKAIEGGGPCT